MSEPKTYTDWQDYGERWMDILCNHVGMWEEDELRRECLNCGQTQKRQLVFDRSKPCRLLEAK